jgi:hypothetical protein
MHFAFVECTTAGLVSAVLIIFTVYEKAAREIQQEGGFKGLMPQQAA